MSARDACDLHCCLGFKICRHKVFIRTPESLWHRLNYDSATDVTANLQQTDRFLAPRNNAAAQGWRKAWGCVSWSRTT